jgi:hypothetical protein
MNILRDALERYDFIHFIDGDVVCVCPPDAEYFDKYKEYDIVFQFDCGVDKVKGIELFNTWCCTGNMSLRNTPGTKHILDAISRFQKLYRDKNDQECMKQYFDNFDIHDVRDDTNAKLSVYPLDEFVNGNILMNMLNYDTSTIKFLHANHRVGRKEKEELLKRVGHWYFTEEDDASKVDSQ